MAKAKKRKGRPSTQCVQRYACGKIKREHRQPKGETEVQIRATVLAYRGRLAGLDEADASRNEVGYELGRMWLRGKITRRQHEAGNRYGLLVGDYQRCLGFPPPYPQGLDLGAARGLSLAGEPTEAWVKRIVAEYMASMTAIAMVGKPADRAVREVCIYDREVKDVENLKRGLDALAEFFRIPADPLDDDCESP